MGRRWKRGLAVFSAAAVGLSIVFSPITTLADAKSIQMQVSSTGKNTIERIYGDTKYDTMLRVALTLKPGKTDNVILATGINFPDALAGVPLAKQKGAPILLVQKTPEKSQEAYSYIKDHLDKNGTIYILGGKAVIPESFVLALTDMGYSKDSIHRLAGYDQYETAVKIAQEMTHDGTEFYVAAGDSFPDALSASVVAATKNSVTEEESAYYKTKGQTKEPAIGGVPILLVPSKKSVPASVINYLNSIPDNGNTLKQTLHIIGGTAIVSETSKEQLVKEVKGVSAESVTRTGGYDRYETMEKAVSEAEGLNLSWKNNGTGMPYPHIYLATGQNFPDSLAGAVLAASDRAPLVLINNYLPKSSLDLLKHFYDSNLNGVNANTSITIFGGTAVVSGDTVTAADYVYNYGKSIEGQPKVTTFAGSGIPGFSDGKNLEAGFSFPSYAVKGTDGTIYVSDTKNHRIRAIKPEGMVSTLSGKSTKKDSYGLPVGGYRDGSIDQAEFNEPKGLAIDSKGNLYVADSGNGAIRVIEKTGEVKTLVKNLSVPSGVAIGKSGEIYATETLKHRILKITPAGELKVFAGGGYEEKDGWLAGGYSDGSGEQAKFNEPTGLSAAANGNLYVADTGNQRIRMITPEGTVTTVAGSGTETIEGTSYIRGAFANGKNLESKFNFPAGIAVGADQSIYVADTYNHKIRKISQDGFVTTVVGKDDSGKQNGYLEQAEFDGPTDVIVLDKGDLLIVDQFNHSIRKLEWQPK